ncbi:methionine aminopeptidase [Gymnopus androsaceus JB14]|uniref:Methionine aminopeptidase n=1 Tax=Gymnopus androsaceus JB14 TaxID=1447944 RepID=A0A6A4GQ64_9AGAR|nr:methionine aminopeptidase [Gymnopus androsaceus JB14]
MSSAILCQSASCINGNPPSKMECPTCSKLGIRGSFFCGQECFKAGCEFHYAHSMNPTHSGGRANSYNPFPNYSFTGTLRPLYPLSPKRAVPDHIPRPDYATTGKPISEAKEGNSPRILNAEEVKKMRTACRLSREVLDIAASHVRPGITTDELDEIVHNATIERNSYPSPLNYRNFPKSVCTSINEVICHGIPDQRILQEGDIVNIGTSTIFFPGYHGDVNGTYPVGKIDEDSEKLIRTTRESLDAAIKMCKPGALFRDIGKTIEPIARANGCAVVRTYTGHGIHELFHCLPNIPHYAKNKAVGTMKAGMVFTIEPMLNLGTNWSEVHWPDNWTATTVDGKRSAQFEETLLITETGVEVITAP